MDIKLVQKIQEDIFAPISQEELKKRETANKQQKIDNFNSFVKLRDFLKQNLEKEYDNIKVVSRGFTFLGREINGEFPTIELWGQPGAYILGKLICSVPRFDAIYVYIKYPKLSYTVNFPIVNEEILKLIKENIGHHGHKVS